MLTKKEVVREIVKCGKDPTYFINNYVKISHPVEGLVPFRTYPFQQRLLRDFVDYRHNIILKARQLGISTISAAYAAWLLLFHKEKMVIVVATKFSVAGNLVKKVKSIIKNLPPWIRMADIAIDNRSSFKLSNESEIKAVACNPEALRSEALSLLIIDEAAHIPNMEEMWTAAYPTLSTGGSCIALSSPKGVGTWYHKTFVDAEAGTNDFYPTTLQWDVHPERDEAWFEKETRNMSKRQIAQELMCNFNTSGDTVFSVEDLERINGVVCEPIHRAGVDRNLWIWEGYKPENTYMISADVARGDGGDYSAFMVFKLETMEVVAEYNGKISLDFYSDLLNSTGREYGNCLLVVENNSVGYSVLEKLKTIGYPNLYYSIKSTHEYIDSNQAQYSSNAVAGFTTSNKTRPLILAKLEEFVRNKLVTVYSKRMLAEMTTFIWKGGRPQAQRTYHDDLIMSCAIGCWIRDTALTVNKQEIDASKAMMTSMFRVGTEFNSKIPGQKGYNGTVSKSNKIKEQQQLFWLYKG